MLTSPISLAVNSVATDHHRVSTEKNSSMYANADGNSTFRVSHQETKSRIRRMARLDLRKVAADPLTAENTYAKGGAYLVIDEPTVGFTDAELLLIVQSLKVWLSDANVNAMLAARH